MDPNILGFLIAGVVLFGFALFAFRDSGKRRFRDRTRVASVSAETVQTGRGCDCLNCAPKPTDRCVAATQCAPPVSQPIVIQGLSCDPNDPQFVHAPDVQMFVDVLNAQREQERQAQSIERFRAAFARMDSDSPPEFESK